eukprot:jgi/Mesvir1/14708/Mv26254-RA.1
MEPSGDEDSSLFADMVDIGTDDEGQIGRAQAAAVPSISQPRPSTPGASGSQELKAQARLQEEIRQRETSSRENQECYYPKWHVPGYDSDEVLWRRRKRHGRAPSDFVSKPYCPDRAPGSKSDPVSELKLCISRQVGFLIEVDWRTTSVEGQVVAVAWEQHPPLCACGDCQDVLEALIAYPRLALLLIPERVRNRLPDAFRRVTLRGALCTGCWEWSLREACRRIWKMDEAEGDDPEGEGDRQLADDESDDDLPRVRRDDPEEDGVPWAAQVGTRPPRRLIVYKREAVMARSRRFPTKGRPRGRPSVVVAPRDRSGERQGESRPAPRHERGGQSARHETPRDSIRRRDERGDWWEARRDSAQDLYHAHGARERRRHTSRESRQQEELRESRRREARQAPLHPRDNHGSLDRVEHTGSASNLTGAAAGPGQPGRARERERSPVRGANDRPLRQQGAALIPAPAPEQPLPALELVSMLCCRLSLKGIVNTTYE